jgi:hypothetical protein
MEVIKQLKKDENRSALMIEINTGSSSLHDVKIRKVICLNLLLAERLVKAPRNAKPYKIDV